jgi:HNH endonuclease
VHHLIHWLRGGETNLENCALLCRRHHVACHEGGWKLVRAPDGAMKVTFDPTGLVLAA